MYYENEILSIVNKYKNDFYKIYNDYLKKCSSNNLNLSTWTEQRILVESNLDKELKRISNPIFSNTLKECLNINKNKEKSINYDFDKFCYYINNLVDEETNSKIFKYNKNYCKNIINIISIEYIKIINYLEHYSKTAGNFNDKAYIENKDKIIVLWNNMLNNSLNEIIEQEYSSVINEINKSV